MTAPAPDHLSDGPPVAWFVQLDTTGKQSFLRRAPDLEAMIGASWSIECAGTHWVQEARSRFEFGRWSIDIGEHDGNLVPLQLTSGRAVVVVPEREDARRLVAEWSRIVFERAPGLGSVGSFVPIADLSDAGLVEALGSLKRLQSDLRSTLPLVRARPSCDAPFRSGVVDDRLRRMGRERRVAMEHEFRAVWPEDPTDVDGWIVVHADGNGIGRRLSPSELVRTWVEAGYSSGLVHALHSVSRSLTSAGSEARGWAIRSIPMRHGGSPSDEATGPRLVRDFLPIVWGGDDMTFAVPARCALDVVRSLVGRYSAITSDPTSDLGRLWGGVTLSIGAAHVVDGDVLAAVRRSEEATALVKERLGRLSREHGPVNGSALALAGDDGIAPDRHVVYLFSDDIPHESTAQVFSMAELCATIDALRHELLLSPGVERQLSDLSWLDTPTPGGVRPWSRRLWRRMQAGEADGAFVSAVIRDIRLLVGSR